MNPLEVLRTKKILQNNPTVIAPPKKEQKSILSLYRYDNNSWSVDPSVSSKDVLVSLFEENKSYWLNVDVLHPETIEEIGRNIGMHQLIVEDILNKNQRPKSDEIDGLFTCVLHMLYYNEETSGVENEQVSFVLGENYLITFQDDCERDLFNPIREKIKISHSRIRTQGPDYLLYALIDAIVDHYFIVLDHLATQIEQLEEHISQGDSGANLMNSINDVRKELMFFKRYTSPVRELIGSIIRSDNPLIKERNLNYFKDIYDHIIQANDLCETYRDVIASIRDLYLNQVNLKMNEVMKFLAIVTALLAPATVIGGIFGMNFERIPSIHNQYGFWVATSFMLIVPLFMLIYFKKKRWF